MATHYLDSFTPEQAIPTPDSTFAPATNTPETTGSRRGSTKLNLWTAAHEDRLVEVTPKGTGLRIVDTASGGHAQVVWRGAVRWVTARHLADSASTKSSTSSGGETCPASSYSDDFATASGKSFDQWVMKTARETLSLGTRLRVTNPANDRAVEVTMSGHGPYVADRCFDLATGAFKAIADIRQGITKVSYEVID